MFFLCRSKEEAKKLYRRLSIFLHPDKGGESDLMSLLTSSYENILKSLPEIIDESCCKVVYQNCYEDVYKPNEKLNIIEDMYEYAATHKRFDLSFLDSIVDFLVEYGYVTSAQYNSLVKIYYSFKMNEKLKKNKQ